MALEIGKVIIKKCHVCAHIMESKVDIKRCERCNKVFLPSNYLNEKIDDCQEFCEEDLVIGITVLW